LHWRYVALTNSFLLHCSILYADALLRVFLEATWMLSGYFAIMLLVLQAHQITVILYSYLTLLIICLSQVGVSPPVAGKGGSVQYLEPHHVIFLKPGASLEGRVDGHISSIKAAGIAADVHPGLNTDSASRVSSAEAEEEEAFLELVTGQQAGTEAGLRHAALVYIRMAGRATWEANCALLHGAESQTGGISLNLACVWAHHLGIYAPTVLPTKCMDMLQEMMWAFLQACCMRMFGRRLQLFM
jgi:hypothetical protein